MTLDLTSRLLQPSERSSLGWMRSKGEGGGGTFDGLTMTPGLIVINHYRETLV